MKRVFVVVGLVLFACNEDGPSQPASPPSFGGSSGAPPSTEGVECTHPGAGSSIGNGRCDCSTTLQVAGEWSTKRTCRERTSCPIKDEGDSIRLTQTGTAVHGESSTFALDGTLCGDVLVWSGGPADGSSKECGQLRFTDATHFVRDSCYVESGACGGNFGRGCPTDKGQCTGTGAKNPESAAAIVKDVCN